MLLQEKLLVRAGGVQETKHGGVEVPELTPSAGMVPECAPRSGGELRGSATAVSPLRVASAPAPRQGAGEKQARAAAARGDPGGQAFAGSTDSSSALGRRIPKEAAPAAGQASPGGRGPRLQSQGRDRPSRHLPLGSLELQRGSRVVEAGARPAAPVTSCAGFPGDSAWSPRCGELPVGLAA